MLRDEKGLTPNRISTNQSGLYYLTEGKVKFKCYDEEFIAYRECLIKLLMYAPRSFEVLEDAVMYDVGGLPRWYDYLTDRESVMALDPNARRSPRLWMK